MATLRALLAAELKPTETALVPVVDPEAAALCHAAGVGTKLQLSLGHKIDPRWGAPVPVTGEVMRLSDGKFLYSGGIWGGQQGDLGPSAVFRSGSLDILISTHATYDWNDEQFQSVGLDARKSKFVVAKNPMNYRMAYGPFAKTVFILDTPGPTPATLRHLKFYRLQRPYFPLDQEIPALRPTIYRSVARC